MKHITKNNIILSMCLLLTASLHAAEPQQQTPAANSLSGWLYTQSFILPKPKLLLYAFEHNYFDAYNTAHKQLVNDALIECLNNKDFVTVNTILDTLNKNFPDKKNLIKNKVAQRIHNKLTDQHMARILATTCELYRSGDEQNDQLTHDIHNLEKEIRNLTLIINRCRTAQEKTLENFHTQYKKHKEQTHLLHTVCPSMDDDEILGNCSDYDDEDNLINPQDITEEHISSKIKRQPHSFNSPFVIARLQAIQQKTTELLELYDPTQTSA